MITRIEGEELCEVVRQWWQMHHGTEPRVSIEIREKRVPPDVGEVAQTIVAAVVEHDISKEERNIAPEAT